MTGMEIAQLRQGILVGVCEDEGTTSVSRKEGKSFNAVDGLNVNIFKYLNSTFILYSLYSL
jgi:hypothetical protein